MFKKYQNILISRALVVDYPAALRLRLRDPGEQVRRWIARRVRGMRVPVVANWNDEYFDALGVR